MTDACAVAHGLVTETQGEHRVLVAVFASPVAEFLVRYGKDLGYTTAVYDPPGDLPPMCEHTDVIATDHHRTDLGTALRDVLKHPVRWVGVLGNPRHEGPHVRLLAELGGPAGEIARVHRPVGLNIGSRTPAEIAVATLAGLVADRNGRPGGFEF
jgi:xanthine dehydrogenase accessory factor